MSKVARLQCLMPLLVPTDDSGLSSNLTLSMSRTGLYCCDASVFPTSTGVNPMITVEATAHMLALGLAQKMARKQSNLKYD